MKRRCATMMRDFKNVMAVDKDKLRQKLHHIQESLRRLETIRERGRAAFLADWLLQAAAERSLQVAIEAVLDTANHLSAQEGWGLPGSYREAIEILLREDILPSDRAQDFLKMVSFRNRIVHLYDRIDPDEVFAVIEDHLGDLEAVIRSVVKRYLS